MAKKNVLLQQEFCGKSPFVFFGGFFPRELIVFHFTKVRSRPTYLPSFADLASLVAPSFFSHPFHNDDDTPSCLQSRSKPAAFGNQARTNSAFSHSYHASGTGAKTFFFKIRTFQFCVALLLKEVQAKLPYVPHASSTIARRI